MDTYTIFAGVNGAASETRKSLLHRSLEICSINYNI